MFDHPGVAVSGSVVQAMLTMCKLELAPSELAAQQRD
jgi:hypothetical protein